MFIIAGIMTEEEVVDYIKDVGNGLVLFDLLRPLLTVDTAAEINEYFNASDKNPEAYRIVKNYLGLDVERLIYARELLSRNIPDLVSNTSIFDLPYEMLYNERNITGVSVEERVRIFQEILGNRGKLDFVTVPGTKENWEAFWSAVKSVGTNIDQRRLYANRIKLYNKAVKPTSSGVTSVISKITDLEMICKGYTYLQKRPDPSVANLSRIYTDLNAVLEGKI